MLVCCDMAREFAKAGAELGRVESFEKRRAILACDTEWTRFDLETAGDGKQSGFRVLSTQ